VKLVRDIGERALSTFVQAFLAAFTINDLSTAKKAAFAGLVAALAVVKGAIASKVGDTGTAALLPSGEG